MTKSARTIRHALLPASMLALLGLAGCGTGDTLFQDIGLTRTAPDEFTVTTRAPLSMPPDMRLPVPTPGATRPQEVSPRQAAEQALVPQTALANGQPTARSSGEQALLGAAGPEADPSVRALVNQEAEAKAKQTSITDRLMFWKSKPAPGIVVDSSAEAKRLRENAALGRSAERGDTPIIQPNAHKSILDSIF